MFSTLFPVGFAGAKKDELTPQWDHGAAVPAPSCWKQRCQGLCSASMLLLGLEPRWLYCWCSNLPLPRAWEKPGKGSLDAARPCQSGQPPPLTLCPPCLLRCAGSLPPRLVLRAGSPVSSAECRVSATVLPPSFCAGWGPLSPSP